MNRTRGQIGDVGDVDLWVMNDGTRHFDEVFADTIADAHWHSTQEVVWNDDRSITFTCKVDGLYEMVWWTLSMGPHCVVKKPPELAQRVKELAAAVVQKYPKL
jgi:predicted DNA-binding transcriptional regulator YafY